MHAIVHPADIQDRDGGGLVMATLFGLYPFLLKLYADGGYQGPVFQSAVKAAMANLNVEIVKRSDQAKGRGAMIKIAGIESNPMDSIPAITTDRRSPGNPRRPACR